MKSTKILTIILLVVFSCLTFGCTEDFSDDIRGLNSSIDILNEQLSEMSDLTEKQRQEIEEYQNRVEQLSQELEQTRNDASEAIDALENIGVSTDGDRLIYPKIELSDGSTFISSKPYDVLLGSYCDFSDYLEFSSSCDRNNIYTCENKVTCCVSDYSVDGKNIYFVSEREISTYFHENPSGFLLLSNDDYLKKYERYTSFDNYMYYCNDECKSFMEDDSGIYFIIPSPILKNMFKTGDLVRSMFLSYEIIDSFILFRDTIIIKVNVLSEDILKEYFPCVI